MWYFVVLALSSQALTLALTPEDCQMVHGPEVVTHTCRLPNATVKFNSVKNSGVNVICKGYVQCKDLPSSLDLAGGRLLTSLGVSSCPPSILRCLKQTINASTISHVILEQMTEPLADEDLKDLGSVNELTIKKAGVQKTVPTAAIRSLPTLKSVRIGGGQIELSSGAFDGAPSIKYLELSEDHLGSIPADSFRGLEGLLMLNIWGNNITHISAGAFRGLENLERLILQSSHIVSIDAGAFAGLSKLKYISLNSNQLNILPDGLLEGLEELQNFTMTPNYADLTLGDHVFSNLPSLKLIDLKYSQISVLPKGLFHGSTGIESLYLNNNNITDLPEDIFSGLSALKTINMNKNLVKTLPQKVFYELIGLEHLSMNNNLLESLPDELFAGLQLLKKVSFDNNSISTLATRTFAFVFNIETLSMRYNRLSDRSYQALSKYHTSPFHYLDKLRILDLTGNYITEIYEDWRTELPELENLILSENKFTKLLLDEHPNASFILNSHLTVDLTKNEIRTIKLSRGPYSRDNTTQSRPTILLDGNPFDCDCAIYYVKLRMTEEVLFKGEPILNFGKAHCASPPQMVNTLITDVSPDRLVCNLTKPEDSCTTIARPSTLEVLLDCYDFPSLLPDTKNKDIKGNFSKEPNINIKSKHPPKSLTNLNVHTLDLSNTSMSSIDFSPSESLKVLNLSYNHIKSIPMAFLKANVTLYLLNNSLDCYCYNQKELNDLKNYKYVYDAVCHDGRHINQLDVIGLCSNQQAAIVGIATFVAIAISVILFCLILYIYFDEIIVYMISRGICKGCLKLRVPEKDKEYDVFISFAHEDFALVSDNLLPTLENDFGQKVCVHYRDWVVGELIPNQINTSVEKSRKTVIVLSESFLESMWANQEFFTAHNLSRQENSSRIILILVNENLKEHPKLSSDIKAYISTNTYLLWDDPNFTKKLSKALERVSYRITWLEALKKKSTEKKSFEGGIEAQLLNGQLVNMATQRG